MKTYMAKPEEIERKWYVVDCDGLVLGRYGRTWQAKLQVYLEAKTSLATLQMLIVATMLLLSTLTKSFLQAKN